MMDNNQYLTGNDSADIHNVRRWRVYLSAVSDSAFLREQTTEITELGRNLDGIRKTSFKYRTG
jgi:hypothetical protein